MNDLPDSVYVYFDLETTGLYHTNPEILQIAAITSNCSDSFDKYLKPLEKTTDQCQNLNNIKYDHGSFTMYKIMEQKMKTCKSVAARMGLLEFISWLKSVGGSQLLFICRGEWI